MEAVTTELVDGLTVKIHIDEDCEYANPRDNDNVTAMLCWHPDYVLGDQQFTTPDGRGAVGEHRVRSVSMLAPGETPQYRTLKTEHEESGRFKSLAHVKRYLELVEHALIVCPLYLYDHSGISISVGSAGDHPFDSAGWDSSDVGFVYVTPAGYKELCGDDTPTQERLEQIVREDVTSYDAYLRGEVYGFTIEDEEGAVLESCWGFVGDEKYCLEEARDNAKAIAADRLEAARLEALEAARAANMDIATVAA